MKSDKGMKPYRVTKVELMAPPTFFVSPNMIYEIVFRADPDDVTLEFEGITAIQNFQERCLDAFEHIPSEGILDPDFHREFVATSFGEFVETLGPRDKGLLRRAVCKLSEPGKKALLKAGN